jgi:hypothetical protein
MLPSRHRRLIARRWTLQLPGMSPALVAAIASSCPVVLRGSAYPTVPNLYDGTPLYQAACSVVGVIVSFGFLPLPGELRKD